MRWQYFLILFFFSGVAFALPWEISGGISGGGGNVIDPIPPDQAACPQLVERLVFGASARAYQFLREKEESIEDGRASPEEGKIFSPLFAKNGRGEDIFAVWRRTAVFVPEAAPCFDSRKNPVDGSIVTRNPDAICVSAYALAHKLRLEEIPAQAAALIVHELSEKLGFDEKSAVSAQSLTLIEIQN